MKGTKLRFHDLRHIFATWLHQSGVSLDVVRPLLGHCDRENTDRYVTYDRMSYISVLNALPRIKQDKEKEAQNISNTEPPIKKTGTNWHGNREDNMLIVPRNVVSS